MSRRKSTDLKVYVVESASRPKYLLRWKEPGTRIWRTKVSEVEVGGARAKADAVKEAGALQDALACGRYKPASKTTWSEFWERVAVEKLATMKKSSQVSYRIALVSFERAVSPRLLTDVTAAAIAAYNAKARAAGTTEATLARNLRGLRACFRWAAEVGMMATVPKIKAKYKERAKERPIIGEEFDRMITAAPKVCPDDPAPWIRLLRGLWWSGLRLSEAAALSWDATEAFRIDMGDGTRKHRPVFRIDGKQKSGKVEVVPVAPEFAEFLSQTPTVDRHGLVFPLWHNARKIGHTIVAIGRAAGVKTDERQKQREVDGKLQEYTATKYASAHTLRRSFCTRWARKVMPAVLQRLARHANIKTTLGFYVGFDSEEISKELWQAHLSGGNLDSCSDHCADPVESLPLDGQPAIS